MHVLIFFLHKYCRLGANWGLKQVFTNWSENDDSVGTLHEIDTVKVLQQTKHPLIISFLIN